MLTLPHQAPPFCGLARVLHVLDGDTIACRISDTRIIVRLAGVDCFEATRTPKLRAQAARAAISLDEAAHRGKQAQMCMKLLLTGASVELRWPASAEEDGEGRDRFGRYIRELWFEGQNVADLLRVKNYAAS